jgi:hypothetical protein
VSDVAAHRWRVYLSVRSTTLTVIEVTTRLGVAADASSDDPGRRWRYVWELESGAPPEAELDEHLRSLAERASPSAPRVAALTEVEGVSVMIEGVLSWSSDGRGSTPSMWVPPDVVAFAAACRVGIDLDTYLPAEPANGGRDR